MKNIFCLFLLISTVAWADEAPLYNEFPAKIVCHAASAKAKTMREFTIDKLNTASPESTLPDQTLNTPQDESAASIVSLFFDNGCDDSYQVALFPMDLLALKKGEVKSVNGLFNYAIQAPDAQIATVPIRCELGQ